MTADIYIKLAKHADGSEMVRVNKPRPKPKDPEVRVNFYITDKLWSRDMMQRSKIINKKRWGRAVTDDQNKTILIRYDIVSMAEHLDGSIDVYMVEIYREAIN